MGLEANTWGLAGVHRCLSARWRRSEQRLRATGRLEMQATTLSDVGPSEASQGLSRGSAWASTCRLGLELGNEAGAGNECRRVEVARAAAEAMALAEGSRAAR